MDTVLKAFLKRSSWSTPSGDEFASRYKTRQGIIHPEKKSADATTNRIRPPPGYLQVEMIKKDTKEEIVRSGGQTHGQADGGWRDGAVDGG